ncbi:hypothetical protein [Pseudogracilibacillus sp. SO30301A]|uniref:hypothetical protein n=1 Tax=Pseudogracilibacillus sp. SO30301A TaxID=3098291 RepID=UPI00300DF133
MDRSESNVWSLLITLLVIGLIILLVIFFINMYFANSAVQPIAKVWENQKQFVGDALEKEKKEIIFRIRNTNKGIAKELIRIN